ncbi:unnamed protein product [Adineta steineri]|uniref:beta-mannosidase n=1 Tax=Adineta steineri TaxID=433720 RepID=A0A819BIA8_9BILA|nr:unnamed protein product [Adineta steineri]CAF3802350.1 unnamed protein product [Adineta steineri]
MLPLISVVCWILIFPSIVSTRTIKIPLTNNDWQISSPNLTARGRIPGTIHTILLASNLIEDPYYGYNDVNQRYLIYQNWTFQTNFTLTKDQLQMINFELVLEQIDTISSVILNDCQLGNTSSMFSAYVFNVTETFCQLKEGNNELKIEIQSPIQYALQQSLLYPYYVPPNCTDSKSHGECHYQFIRKEACSFSWGWGPAFAPMGITGDIYLQATDTKDTSQINFDLFGVNVRKSSDVNDSSCWHVDFYLKFSENPFQQSNTYQTIHFRLLHTNWTYTLNLSSLTFPNANYESASITVDIPSHHIKLWWPNGYGDQYLYEFQVEYQSPLKTKRIGFRTIELVEEDYTDLGLNGTSFYFKVNNQTIFIKGSNWIPADAFQERITREYLERLLYSTAEANINMLRVWGGGVYESDDFYELTDQLGIMIWQDFMFSDSLYPTNIAFLQNIQNEISFQVNRLKSHPSIAIWSGNNENEAGISKRYSGYHIPDVDRPKYENDYRLLYVNLILVLVETLDPTRPFVTSSPSNGWETVKENYIADDPQSPLYGDVHYYNDKVDPWNYTYVPISRFLSETGLQSMPSLETLLQITNDSKDLSFESPLMRHRQHNVRDGQKQLLLEMMFNLPLPLTNDSLQNFTLLIYLSQINQAMYIKTHSDHCRRYSSRSMMNKNNSQGHTMGLMYWQLNDIWQAPTWSSIEYGGKWKMSHYYAKQVYQSVYVLPILEPYLTYDGTSLVKIYFINEKFNGTHGQVHCQINDFHSFTPHLRLTFDVNMNSTDVKILKEIPYQELLRQSECSNATDCILGCSYSEDFENNYEQILFFTQPKNYQLQNPQLQILSVKNRTQIDFDITFTIQYPALFLWFDVFGVKGRFNQNGFHLFQTNKTITYSTWIPSTSEQVRQGLTFQTLYDVTNVI